MNNLRRASIATLHEDLMELQQFRADQHTALVEFSTGSMWAPTREELAEARTYESEELHYQIDAIMCELERRNPGTFINTNK